MTFASMANEFTANNCALLGLSVDSNPSHIDWSRAMEKYQWNDIKNPKITFPIVADDLGSIARLYGMLMPTASATRTVRTVFFIDPEGTIRAMLLYPLTTGRNMNEIMRLLLALQAYDKTGYATPADWMPGEPQVMPAPQTMPLATQRLDDQKTGAYYCLDWYICFTKGSKPVIMQHAAKTDVVSSVTPKNIQYNIASTMDMMETPGEAQAVEPKKQTIPTGLQSQNMISDLLSVSTKAAAHSKTPAATVSKTTRPRIADSGIMEQNRMLFDTDNMLGMNNEYKITRDYPNNGI